MFFFSLTMLATFALSRQQVYTFGWILWIVAVGLALGCVVSVKFTALGSVGFVGCFQLYLLFKTYVYNWRRWEHLPRVKYWFAAFLDAAIRGIAMLGIAAIVLYASFIMHLKYLPYRGEGDAFMSQEWRNSLVDKPAEHELPRLPAKYLPRLSTRERIHELVKTMWTSNMGLRAAHPGGSFWYEWPLMKGRLVHYWGGPLSTQHVSSVGNPAVWYLAVAGIIIVFLLAIYVFFTVFLYQIAAPRSRARTKLPSASSSPSHLHTHHQHTQHQQHTTFSACLQKILSKRIYLGLLLVIGYVGNWAPYVFIKRVCFNYHYLPALLMGCLICAYVWDIALKTLAKYTTNNNSSNKGKRMYLVAYLVYALLLGVIGWTFLHFAPWTYGSDATVEEQRSRMWIKEWYPGVD
eukprot:TRINITY_DN1158_c6_g1_i1.p1 TRINITY_DN1158_c6_g1~~TRINITY_DN1158_c6_g1_i1.p1  ORF type:complete len:405 (+),score=66.40 TRINITY_DN1158_c6_g1_i1:913-2127(+)